MNALRTALLLCLLTWVAAADSATQTLQLTILPAPAQVGKGLPLPEQPFLIQARDADSRLQWTRETVGPQQLVTVTVVPSGEKQP